VRSCEKRLDTFSAQKSAIEIKMAAPGFYDQSNASDITVQGAAVESIDFHLKWVEEVCLQRQEGLEQMNQSGA
tara:strand:- start:549 stop:767 length:219 start_codon:yes stop_codon:yes gene_type:complete